jgi:hypothetical protein
VLVPGPYIVLFGDWTEPAVVTSGSPDRAKAGISSLWHWKNRRGGVVWATTRERFFRRLVVGYRREAGF